jgi:hypothetical protein
MKQYVLGAIFCRQSLKNGGVCVFMYETITYAIISVQEHRKEQDIEICSVTVNMLVNNYIDTLITVIVTKFYERCTDVNIPESVPQSMKWYNHLRRVQHGKTVCLIFIFYTHFLACDICLKFGLWKCPSSIYLCQMTKHLGSSLGQHAEVIELCMHPCQFFVTVLLTVSLWYCSWSCRILRLAGFCPGTCHLYVLFNVLYTVVSGTVQLIGKSSIICRWLQLPCTLVKKMRHILWPIPEVMIIALLRADILIRIFKEW